MILEGLINGCVVDGKNIGFRFVKDEQKESLKSFLDAVYDMHRSFYDNNQIEKLNGFLEANGQKTFKVMNSEEIEYRKSLQKKVLDAFSKDNYFKFKYGSHRTTDYGQRYFSDAIMKTTPDEEGDLKYNRRVTYLLERAQNGDFKPGSEASKTKDPDALAKLTKDKDDFIQLHRDYLSVMNRLDVEKLAIEDITDEELAENAADYFKIALLAGQFDNIRENFKKWGIEDEECSKIMSVYDSSADYVSYIKQRLDKMYSGGYAYYEPSSASESIDFIDGAPKLPPIDVSFAEVMKNQKNIENFALNSEINAICKAFEKLGVQHDKLMIKIPGDEHPFETIDLLLHRLGNKSEFILIDSDHPEVEMKFKLSKDLPYTRLNMLKDHAAVKDAAVPEMPKEVGFLGKIADFFTNLRTGHKPRQEAYQKQLDKRNYILSSKELIKEFDDNIKKIADIKNQERLEHQESMDINKNGPETEMTEMMEMSEIEAKKEEKNANEMLQNAKVNFEKTESNEQIREKAKLKLTDIKEEDEEYELEEEDVKKVPKDPEKETKEKYQQKIEEKRRIHMQIDARDSLVHNANRKKSKYSDELERYDRVKDVRDRLYASYLLNKDGSHLVDMKKCVAELFYIAGVEQRLTDSMKEGDFDEIYDQLSDSFEEKNMKEGIEEIYNNEYFNAYFAKMDPIDFNRLGTSVIEPDPLNKFDENDIYAEHRNDILAPVRKELDKFTEFIQNNPDLPEKMEQLNKLEANKDQLNKSETNIVTGP